jgi:small-conductance mechanosensitive channel
LIPLATGILDRAGESLGGFLPRLGGAIVLLVVGIIAARVAGRLMSAALERAGVDRLAERFGADAVLERAGLGRSLSRIAGRALRIGLTLVVAFAALSLLGLQFLSESLNAAVLFLPNVLVAAALVLVGIVLGALTRERVDRLTHQMDLPVSLGAIAQGAVVGVFAITAAAQVAVSTAILMALVGILLAGVVATFAIAFGFGGSRVAAELTAGRYLREAYTPGTDIGFGDYRGRVESVESAATVLRTAAGHLVRVPNELLLNSVVTVYEESATP